VNCARGLNKPAQTLSNLVDWWAMFSNNEHHYAAQLSKLEVRDAIKGLIEIRKGLPVVKVKDGYAFDPEGHEHRQKSKQGQTPPRNPIAATPD